jgi:hypothetical protein
MHGSPTGIASGAVHVPCVRHEIWTTLTAELRPEDIASVVSFLASPDGVWGFDVENYDIIASGRRRSDERFR